MFFLFYTTLLPTTFAPSKHGSSNFYICISRFLLFSSLSSSYRPVKHAAYPLSGLQERLLPYTYSDRVIAEATAPLFIIIFQVSINTARRGMQFVQMMRMSQMEEKKLVKLF